jgi:hypothetical protein
VFGLPGIGSLVAGAVLRRDYPVIQGALLVIAGLYVLINLAIDLLYLVHCEHLLSKVVCGATFFEARLDARLVPSPVQTLLEQRPTCLWALRA